MADPFEMTRAQIKMFRGVGHLGDVNIAGGLKPSQSKDDVLGGRGNASIALAFDVGVAFHVMGWLRATIRSIQSRL
jgi:hypothetical protein